MNSIESIITELKDAGVQISAEHGNLKAVAEKGVIDERLRALIGQHKAGLINYINQLRSNDTGLIPEAVIAGSYPLSSGQHRLWILSQFDQGSAAYNMGGVYEFNGNIDVKCLELALSKLIDRHEILRTMFREEASGEVRQVVLPAATVPFSLQEQDVTGDPDGEAYVWEQVKSDFANPFNLEKDFLLRIGFYRLAANRWVFSYTLHHIISDEWSMDILIRELLVLYREAMQGGDSLLRPLRVQYKDYAVWQQQQLQATALKEDRAYWLKQFSGTLPVLSLPGDHTRPLLKTFKGQKLQKRLDAKTYAALQALCLEEGVTLFMGLLAAVNALLHRYTGQEDIIIGSPVAGRHHADLEDQIGFYVNTLALRNNVDGKNSFRDLLKAVKSTTIDAYDHQAYPFDELVEELGIQRDVSRNPLFDVMVILVAGQEDLEAQRSFAPFEVSGYGKTTGEEHNVVSKFDFTFTFRQAVQGLEIELEYNSDIYNRGSMERLAAHFVQLLTVLLDDRDKALQELDYLSIAEQDELLYGFNTTEASYPAHKTIIDLFEEQAELNPQGIAVVFEGKSLSYADLDKKANQLGHYLRSLGVDKESLVPICIDRSLEMIIGLLGILKAGGAYVPIDPELPPDRIRYMLEDTGALLVISTGTLAGVLPQDLENLKVVALDTDAAAIAWCATDRVASGITASSLAYVIYTSGSTGKPKGVMNEHRGIVNRLLWTSQCFPLAEEEALLQKTTFAFDVSVWELFWPLVSGVKLVFAAPGGHKDTAYLRKVIAAEKITIVHFVPSMLDIFLQDLTAGECSGLRRIVCSGEELKAAQVAELRVKLGNLSLINLYGPTEAAVEVSYWHVPEKPEHVLIGRPVPNTSLYILDRHQQLLPVGTPGELYIGGVQVARGYLNLPALSRERFLENPFQTGERLYRTGDICRWLPEGDIEYMGRADDQVKIRGYRIELGEIENVLVLHPDITSAAVIALKGPLDKDPYELVAYVVSNGIPDAAVLREYLGHTLPYYMVPGYYVPLAALPLTGSGKVDKKALPSPQGLGLPGGVTYAAARNNIESGLVVLWEELLGHKPVGIHDNFFDLGGHSLKAMRLLSQIHRDFGIKLLLKDLFTAPVLEQQGMLIASSAALSYESIPVVALQDHYSLSSAQRRMWILSQFEESNVAYNIPAVFLFRGNLDRSALSDAFQKLIDRYEILRTIFMDNGDGAVRQYINTGKEPGFAIDYKDLRNHPDQKNHAGNLVASECNRPFDLSEGPLLRLGLYQTENEEWIFSFVIHHIISDAWSVDLLTKELLTLYNDAVRGAVSLLEPLSIQYKDYAAWQQEQLRDGVLAVHRQYWLQQFSGTLPLLELPGDHPRPSLKTFNGNAVEKSIPEEIVSRLKELVLQDDATLFMGLLAGVHALLYRYTGQEDIVTGTPVAGRDHADLDGQVGLFVNMLSVRSRFKGTDSFRQLLAHIKQITLAAYDHQGYPFDLLVDELGLLKDLSRNPLFDISIGLQNTAQAFKAEALPRLDNLEVQLYEAGENRTSKFDLTFNFMETASGMSLHVQYNSDIYEQDTIMRLLQHLEGILKAATEQPDRSIAALEYLDTKELQQLRYEFSEPRAAAPIDKTIIDIFREQVSLSPEQAAVVFDKTVLSYRELDEKSNRLARYLLNTCAIQPDDRVGVLMDRSEFLIIALLGILKSGGAYVPIDPEYPKDRKAFIVQDTAIKALLTQMDYIFDLEYYQGTIIALDVQLDTFNEPLTPPDVSIRPSNLAYVMYTSGSTGKPKGVMVEHRGVVRLVRETDYVTFNSANILLSTGAISFDATTFEYWGMLLNGGCLVLCRQETLLDSGKLATEITSGKINMMWFTAGWLNQLIDTDIHLFEGLKTVIAGGDKLSSAHIKLLRAHYPGMQIVNGYGPTENTTFSLTYSINGVAENIPIGKPISNSTAYILDTQGKMQPVGIIGEIYLGGSGLARGYINQQLLTEERFVPNPFKAGERFYKTGDLGRWLPDGNIEFAGRKDEQVKIRGYRIEPGEIERVLVQHTAIDAAVVVALSRPGGIKELAAYLVSQEPLIVPDLRTYLGNILPSYMLPAHYVALETFPLTSNGKVDKKALPDPASLEMERGTEYMASRNSMEEQFVQIWQELLAKDRIGIHDDFFLLGGDSIKILRMLSEVKKRLQLSLSISEIYKNTTIAGIVTHINEERLQIEAQGTSAGVEEERVKEQLEALKQRILSLDVVPDKENISDIYPMSDIEKGMVFAAILGSEQGVYHDLFVKQRVFPGFDISRFRKAMELLVDRHPILRTGFNLSDYETEVQIVYKNIPVVIPYEDLSGSSPAEQEIMIRAYVEGELRKSFDPAVAPLWKMQVFNAGGNHVFFVIQFHHAILDGWSDALLMTELNNLYLKLETASSYIPEPLKSSYKDFIIQHEIDRNDVAVKDFWLQELSGYERMDLFTQEEIVEEHTAVFDNDFLKQLEQVAGSLNTTVKVVSLSAYFFLLKILSNNSDIVTGLVTNTRPSSEDSDRVLGCFLNTIPLRVLIDEQDTWAALITRVHTQLIELKDKERLSLLEISRIHGEHLDSGNPFFDTLFNYIDYHVYEGIEQETAPEDRDKTAQRPSGQVSGSALTNTYFDFTIECTGGLYHVAPILTRRFHGDLSARQIAGLYSRILQCITGDVTQVIGTGNYLDEAEQQLLLEFNHHPVPGYPLHKTIVQLFEEQAQRTPSAPAVLSGTSVLSYAELNEKSNQLARYLMDHYVIKRGDLVGILLDRSEWLLVVLLGILKSGGAYVPVDPEYPQDRVDYMLADSNCKVVIDSATLARFETQRDQYPVEHLQAVSGPSDPAYVIYTSGSTGRPKGVVVAHNSIVNIGMGWIEQYRLENQAVRLLQLASVSFDVFMGDVCRTFLSGGCMTLCPNDIKADAEALYALLVKDRITILESTPGVIVPLIEYTFSKGKPLDDLVLLILGSEACSMGTFRALQRKAGKHIRLINSYGTTETTIDSTYYEEAEGYNIIPDTVTLIGKPFPGTNIYIVAPGLQRLQPPGLPGEICIGGAGLARAYLNQAELTAKKFTDHPFQTGERLYRTGDKGRWLPDGNIEYMGRTDLQVKIRGYRIEPGEIENVLNGHPDIMASAVIAQKGPLDADSFELVAYIVSTADLGSAALQEYLALSLPAFMIPGYYIPLSSLPLTANGKVNRKALPAPDGLGLASGITYIAAGTDTELRLVAIWEELLGQSPIGIHDNFFNLGGHSLKATRLLSRIKREFNAKLTLKDLFAVPVLEQQALMIDSAVEETYTDIPLAALQDSYPLSSSQRRMWVMSQFEESSIAYHMSSAYEFEGDLDVDALRQCLVALITRHEILRTLFRESEDGVLAQFILSPEASGFGLAVHDLRSAGKDELHDLEESLLSDPFDLASGPLLRAALYRVSDQKWIFSYVMHHIISDGWSMGVLLRELLTRYNSCKEGAMVTLPPLSIQYKDYACWQQQQLEGESLMVHRSYWLDQFSGPLPVLELPSDYARPAVKTSNGGLIHRVISPELTHLLDTYNQAQGTTLFMGLLGVVHVLLYRYTNQEDIIIGSPVAGRDHMDLEAQIGFYINTLALRTWFNGQAGYTALMETIREVTQGAYEHQVYPFDELVDELELQRDMSRNALFDVMVVLQNADSDTTNGQGLSGLEVSGHNSVAHRTSQFDLVFNFERWGGGIDLGLEYNNDIYKRESMERLASHFVQLLAAVLEGPEVPLQQLDYLSVQEREELLHTFNSTDTSFPLDKTIVTLFEQQADRNPDGIAVVFEGAALSYRTLDERANQLGHYLRSLGIGVDSLVPICIDRSLEMVIGLMGILKAGAAYVPVDPDYPADRIRYILDDTRAGVILSTSSLVSLLPLKEGIQVVLLDQEDDACRLSPCTRVAAPIRPEHLLYVIYTSGSTGKPKGVEVEHRGIVNILHWTWSRYGFTEQDIVLQKSTFTFDASVWEFFGALCRGLKIIMCHKDDVYAPLRLATLIREHQVTLMHLVPSLLNTIIDEILYGHEDPALLDSLRHVFAGGEALSMYTVRRWYDKMDTPLSNNYGPTEGSIAVTYYDFNKEEDRVLIGEAVPNATLYILDENRNMQPVGVPGELYIGGVQVARGYLNQPELTAERFITSPFKNNDRLYRTGDRCRWLPDGNIEYIGRADDQVKIRGYRIELGEIENALNSHPDIISSVVTAWKGSAEAPYELVAYIISKGTPESIALREHLGHYLPAYMIPGYYVPLPTFPLTASGKIDKRALPDPEGLGMSSGVDYIIARNTVEARLIAIWEQLLGRSQISVYDNFFDLGGHSLKATGLLSRIQREFNIRLLLKDLFMNPVLEQQAALIASSVGTKHEIIPVAGLQASYPLSSSQRRMWILCQFGENSVTYNMPRAYIFEGDLDIGALRYCLTTLISRHEILRTVFYEEDNGDLSQVVLPSETSGFNLVCRDLRDAGTTALQEMVRSLYFYPFDLSEGSLFRAELYQLASGKWVFAYVMHHIIGDGWSMSVLLQELLFLYNACKEGHPNTLQPLRIQYKDYACWQQTRLQGDLLAEQRAYWRQHLGGPIPVLELPADYVRPAVKTSNGGIVSRTIGNEALDALDVFARTHGTTMFMNLLGIVNAILYRYTGQGDIIIGSPVAGRNHADLDAQIGLYVNTLALRTHFNGEDSFTTLMEAVREVTLDAYDHQELPFDEIVNDLVVQRDMSRNALFDVMLVLQDEYTATGQTQGMGDLKIGDYTHVEHHTSEFDLLFYFQRRKDGMGMNLLYSNDIYKQATIENLADHLIRLLGCMLERPEASLDDLDYLSSGEHDELLQVFNTAEVAGPDAVSVMSLFEERAARDPEAIALRFEEQVLTYRELNERADQLGHYLVSFGVQEGHLVPVCIDRSPEMLIGLLGVMKTGAAYVPVDPLYPADRIRYILEDTRASVILSTSKVSGSLPPGNAGFRIVLLDKDSSLIDQYPRTGIDVVIRPEQLAYIIYTSGSTGQPKGVMIEHGSLVSRIKAETALLFDGNMVSCLASSFTFDVSLLEIFLPLINGGAVAIPSASVDMLGTDLVLFLEEYSVNVLQGTPSFMMQFVLALCNTDKELPQLRNICIGGESLSENLVGILKKRLPAVKISNHYGPTEATIDAIIHTDLMDFKSNVIGKPIAGACIYITNNKGHLQPVGLTGEICIGGAGLARGYLNQPELTLEKFIANPFKPGERLYRTGDKGRWLPDGNIGYEGRIDDQVKIRGYRIELGEIEHALNGHPDITAAVVIAQKGPSDTDPYELIAYVVSGAELGIQDLRGYLGLSLPTYMIPGYYIPLSYMPLTSNGKVDKKALPAPEGLGLSSGVPYIAARNAMEEHLITIWQELLGAVTIGVFDNFFDLGGHSLKATRLLSRIRQEFDIKLSLKDLFAVPVLEQQAGLLDVLVKEKRDEINLLKSK